MKNFDYQKAYELLEYMTLCALRVRMKHSIVTKVAEDLRNSSSIENIIMKAAEVKPHYTEWKGLKQEYNRLRKEFEPFINDSNGRTVEYLDLLIFEHKEIS